MLDNLIELIPKIFADHPRPIDMPVWLDYSLGVMIRNMMIFALFRYIRPDEISIDYLDLLQTDNSASFQQKYLCPCGNTLLNFQLHWLYLRAKSESSEHYWLFEAYMTFEYAVKGRKIDTKESSATAGTGSIQSHKIDEYFERGWTQLVLPEFKRDRQKMENLKKLFIYARCTYRFRAGTQSFELNKGGDMWRNFRLITNNRRMYGI